MANRSLAAAKAAKQDEFYTQWADIEREMNAYLEYNPEVFKNKVILLPCDDPEWSSFSKFFALHFMEYGIKKLISTSYAPESNAGGAFYTPTLFDDPNFDEKKDRVRGKIFVLDREDVNGDGRVDIDDLKWDYLDGDGDFRSPEVTALRNEADVVVTNPPFSLFRAFVDWLDEGDIQFSIIGNVNAITYPQVFEMIQHNKLWKGATANNTDMVFRVPAGIEVRESDKDKAGRMGYPSTETEQYTRLGNACWFTNIDHGRRHEPMPLLSMSDNLVFNKKIAAVGYPAYENFGAIEVNSTMGIPSDFDGVMGVPITFLDKFNPEQFEIVGMSRFTKTTGMSKKFVEDYYASGQTGQIHEGHPDVGYYDKEGRPVVPYRRIFIRHLKPDPKKDA